MSNVWRYCGAAGCREIIPDNQRYCKKHQYLEKLLANRYKRDYQSMTKKQKHEYNHKVYQQRKQRSEQATHDYNRFYRTQAWKKLSHRMLREQPVCVLCMRKGIVRKADAVDHIKPIRERWDLRLDPDNLQPLCSYHHRIKTRQDHARERRMHHEGTME